MGAPPGSAGNAASPAPDRSGAVLVGAGDIAVCDGNGDEATAALLDAIPGTVFTTGDNAYPDGTDTDYEECYGPSWGRHRDRTMPAPGNHEYQSRDARGYYEYFGATAADGYYAFDLGDWRVYSLDSERVTDEQIAWLTADLAENPSTCVFAYWHRARFSSGMHGSDRGVAPLWEVLDEAGAEVIVSGHDHDYERFAPMDATGTADESGVRQFVVGTGGSELRAFERPEPNSEVRWSDGYGVIRFNLRSTDYSWEFVPAAGATFEDSGSASCQ